MNERREVPPVWHALVAMILLAAVVYFPAALRAEFVDFDDPFFFGFANPALGIGNPEFQSGFFAVFDPSRPIANAYLPVAHASLWIDWWLGGGGPLLPHLHALLLHAVAAVVLVRLLFALGAARVVAYGAGALFVVHPALAESVAWVSGRKDLLSGLFVFAALWLVVRWCRRPRALTAIGLLLCAALAMYAKATAVVLPLLAVLVCLRVGGTRARFAAPLLLLVVTVPIAMHHQRIAAAEGTLVAGSVTERLAQVPGVFAHYVATAAWPLHLNVLYPEVDTLRAFRDGVGGALVVVAAALLAIGLAWWRPRWRLVAFGLAAFAIALLPFNTAYPGSSIAAADRYLYLAIPGLALAVVETLRLTTGRAAPWLAAAVVLPFAWLAGGRAHDFGDSESLWQSSLRAEPANAVAQLNLVKLRVGRSTELRELRERLDAAIAAARDPEHERQARLFRVEIELNEADYGAAAAHARAAVDAAKALVERETSATRKHRARELLLATQLAAYEPVRLSGDAAAANELLRAAEATLPGHPDVIAFASMRDLVAALAERPGTNRIADDDPRATTAERTLDAALATYPNHAGLWCARAAWDHVRDRVLPALRNYRRAQEAQPRGAAVTCLDAWLGASRLLREREQYAEAEAYARAGLERRADPALRQELALALVGQGKLDGAIVNLEAYLKVRPDDHDTGKVLANVLIGLAYGKLGQPGTDPNDVLRIVDKALAYNPNEGKAHLVLGRLLREQRQLTKALHHLEIAFRALPDFDDARRLYAECLADIGYDRVLRRDDDGAFTAWQKCLAIAPPDLDTVGIRTQYEAMWQRFEKRGVERAKNQDRDGAIADFRRCLAILPDQHWAAWLLATVLQKDPAADLDELERLCRLAVAWQERNGLDGSEPALLLATTLVRRDRLDEAKRIARAALEAATADAKPQVVAALRRLAGD